MAEIITNTDKVSYNQPVESINAFKKYFLFTGVIDMIFQ